MTRDRIALTVLVGIGASFAHAEPPPVTLQNHLPPHDLSSAEPFLKSFSYEKALHASDHAALDWQVTHNCITCHTNGFYLVGRALSGKNAEAYAEVRKFTQGFLAPHVTPDAPKSKRRTPGDMGMVSATAFLAISDINTEGKLGETTKHALDYIWKRQSKSGAWERWIKCNWGPYESDDHFGPSLVALAMGIAAQDDYVKTEAAAAGDRHVLRYLKANPPESLHQMGMLLWASAYRDDLADKETIAKWQQKLFAAQQENGGWVLPDLGDENWKRSDGKEQSTTPDPYATGFAVHVLQESGIARDDPRLMRARNWLKRQQRESGRWFTRSPRKDNKHYISNAATSFALLALAPED